MQIPTTSTTQDINRAQRLRLQRMIWGFGNQACSMLIAIGLFFMNMLPGDRLVHYAIAILAINLTFLFLLKSNLNLRFRDPSMTFAQIVAPLLPSIYVMFYIADPQARTAFLLMATGALLFGMFALSRFTMFILGGIIVMAYLLLLAALHQWAPERINLHSEMVIVFAYGSILAIVAYLGSFIAGLRYTLRDRNKALGEALAQVEELATRDPLTHLPNRRAVVDRLRHESARTERRTVQQTMLYVSMLDVDNFKDINDIHGHETGDLVLCRISNTLRQSLREGDFVGRFGGEEFVILFPESAHNDAFLAAERIREVIARLTFPELGETHQVTVSQGVAAHLPNESVEQTLKRADVALYEAKRQGRNCSVMAPESS